MDESSTSQVEATKNAGLPVQIETVKMGASSNERTASAGNNESKSLGCGSNQDAATGNEGPSSQKEIITRMPRTLYNAAAEGKIETLKENKEHLDLQLTPNKNTVLHVHIAAQDSDRSESAGFVKEILDMCPSLLLQANTEGETPLHMAARYGLSGVVKVLIERAKALHEELESGVGEAREMLRMTNNEGDTALHAAVQLHCTDGVKLLTQEDPNFSYSTNNACETPLYLAVERGFHDLVDVILQTCTSPAYDGPYGRTALHAATICNEEEMARKLLGKKQSLAKEVGEEGWSPLHYAAHLGHESIVRLLLDSDESAAYLANKDGKTALHLAASRNHGIIVEELIKRCPDCCELVDSRSRNVLHYAAESMGCLEVWKVFLKYSSSVSNLMNKKDADGNTPAHLSFVPEFPNQIILKHPRVDKMALNKQNMTPLDTLLSRNLEYYQKLESKSFHRYLKTKEESWRKEGYCPSRRNAAGKAEDRKPPNRDKDYTAELQETSETHLIVATLIATVTFAAAFTLPGGYIGDDGPDAGTPILMRKAAFEAFVISDTIAMTLSTSAVLIHFFMAVHRTKEKLLHHYTWAFFLTIFSMIAMVVAFIAGMYAVLAHSSGLATYTICFTASCFFFFLYYTCKNRFK